MADFAETVERAGRHRWRLVMIDLDLDLDSAMGEAMANMVMTLAQLERQDDWAADARGAGCGSV